jgi:hypothetical protein
VSRIHLRPSMASPRIYPTGHLWTRCCKASDSGAVVRVPHEQTLRVVYARYNGNGLHLRAFGSIAAFQSSLCVV